MEATSADDLNAAIVASDVVSETNVNNHALLTPETNEIEQLDFPVAKEEQVYAALVIDSGPIIRLTGLTSLRGRAERYYTVPGVLQEIRDAKARDHFDQLPFQLVTREASAEGIHAVTQFARQTGDYHSLSAVDLQVLGLVYDLEREGCEGNMEHVRTTPKRKIGLGKIEFLSGKTSRGDENKDVEESKEATIEPTRSEGLLEQSYEPGDSAKQQPAAERAANAQKTWAMIANLTEASTSLPIVEIFDDKVNNLAANLDSVELGGQFSDAEESDENFEDDSSDDESSEDDDEGYGDPEKEISDEECDVYILDPEEVEERNRSSNAAGLSLEQELMSEFPSFAASLHVPYEGEDSDGEVDEHGVMRPLTEEELNERKTQSLKPISKSGKLYNSFPKYKTLMKPKDPPSRQVKFASEDQVQDDQQVRSVNVPEAIQSETMSSRIIGGAATSGQELEVEDDGEGWITCSKDIHKMKAAGGIFPTSNSGTPNNDNNAITKPAGPPVNKRAACATTDFAMQNVILQMNLEMLSVDGVKIRRLKSWVLRCGACFTVHADGAGVGPVGTKRMFCSRCGSDMMQRISASVDGKSGRLRLHLSQRHKNNLRGTKFSLPKPGTGNRFQGDLLLREDQLLTGAWNQKVKMMTGGKSRRAAQSMFGSDLASTVGCNASAVKNDIKVGFGRRNPNAAKGRERRGKKEKSSDKACGLRRY